MKKTDAEIAFDFIKEDAAITLADAERDHSFHEALGISNERFEEIKDFSVNFFVEDLKKLKNGKLPSTRSEVIMVFIAQSNNLLEFVLFMDCFTTVVEKMRSMSSNPMAMMMQMLRDRLGDDIQSDDTE